MDKPIRVRGGKRHSRSIDGTSIQEQRQVWRKDIRAEAKKMIPGISTTGRIPQDGIYFDGDGFSIHEEYDPLKGKIVQTPILDKSLTARTFMGIFPQRPTEKILIIGRQFDRATGKMVQTTDEQVLQMSDRTLLRRGNPFAQAVDIHRQTSISKRIVRNVDGDMINRESVRQERAEANQPGVSVDELCDIADGVGKPPAPTGKRTSGTLLGKTQQKRAKR